ncbi:hypothetical protein B0H17DRAFT_1024308 [Mycena rosella]|uniref:Uncharacterized protein n=1 Tax=Mycena rosella TaxID=1033263 RepID=A0AAD7FMA4_MYCRO|nr:hypothetical protein B0H17DRAFT_1024308 [Mycena rosella]
MGLVGSLSHSICTFLIIIAALSIPSAEVDHKYSGSIHAGADVEGWLTQANHIFKCLDITSDYEDYGVILSPVILKRVWYHLTFSGPTDGLPPGYLFLCPLKYLHSDAHTCFWHPDFAAYWSLDPAGLARLSTEEATDLGFPSFKFAVTAHVYSWDSSVYDGLRQFHEAKGFDPYSQDITRHMGCQLYELYGVENSFAHLEETNSEDYCDETIHREISPAQNIASTETTQSQTPQWAHSPTH